MSSAAHSRAVELDVDVGLFTGAALEIENRVGSALGKGVAADEVV